MQESQKCYDYQLYCPQNVLLATSAICIHYLLFTWTTTTMMLYANQHPLQLLPIWTDTRTQLKLVYSDYTVYKLHSHALIADSCYFSCAIQIFLVFAPQCFDPWTVYLVFDCFLPALTLTCCYLDYSLNLFWMLLPVLLFTLVCMIIPFYKYSCV